MIRLISIFVGTVAVAIVSFLIFQKQAKLQHGQSGLLVTDLMSRPNSDGYAQAFAPRPFIFPQDHGPHPEFQTEWWYYTGNLTAINGRHFGFQFTIFRFAIAPKSPSRPSAWATNQIYMAHFAITDVAEKKFYAFERFSRGANRLAGAQGIPFKVWVEDWYVSAIEVDSLIAFPTMKIQAAEAVVALELELSILKPVALHGDRGLSPKGIEPGNASYYYSLPRMSADGQIRVKGQLFEVTGEAWLDREWSTSALGPDQVGWDWFALQLSDGREVMYYQIRNRDESIRPFSRGSWIDKNGICQELNPSDVQLNVLEHWTSPHGSRYPSRWRLQIPKHQLGLVITPFIADQELKLSIRYWEGAVKIEGFASGDQINGHGYVELTGYDSSSIALTVKNANR
ncbi:MAG: carotenoid 1,2-hydratase [candidate division KSB1 bacterium]|nr:carotenoid 1,2-hydratase [candidate division KSB1 bacterium]MDZ7356160.1 carotenoid 1,2-hydratase [candidate division KSB1 bacterium]MDZ7398862.1 carotenoid 1,2-hydratase [candidate division KSB1 bacterium]